MRMGRPREHTDEEILDALRQFYATKGRAPREREMRGMKYGVPTVSVLKNRWGSKLKAFAKAGIPPNRAGGQMVHGGRMMILPIDPAKAEAVTRAKRQWWEAGCPAPKPTWIHPYRRTAKGKHGLNWTHPYARQRSA